MKTTRLFSAGLAGLLLAAQTMAATDVVADWNFLLTAAQQTSGQNAAGRNRSDAILTAVFDATRNGLIADANAGRSAESVPAGANLDVATAQAAYSALAVLYPQDLTAIDAQLAASLAGIDDSAAAVAAGRQWGEHVAQVILAEQGDNVSLNAYSFAESIQPSASPAPVPAARAEQAAIGPGRYRFSVLAGAPGTKGYGDGIGAAARFDNPGGIAVDTSGNAYVSERDMNTIRKISSDGVVTTLAGTAGQTGSQDGAGAVARFNQPRGLAVDGAGNVYVADLGNHAVRKISPSGLVTTIVPVFSAVLYTVGTKSEAPLDTPGYVAVDNAGNLFVSEIYPNSRIRKLTPSGAISTLSLKLPSNYSSYSGVWPEALCVDHAGVVYGIYSDYWDFYQVVKFVPAADGNYEGSTLEPLSSPRYWSRASSVAVDDADNLYVKYEGDPICCFAPSGEGQVRYAFGNSGGYLWNGMGVDNLGRIVALPDPGYPEKIGTIEVGTFDPAATGLTITLQPFDDLVDISAPVSVSLGVLAAGMPSLSYQWSCNSSPIPGATTSSLYLKNVRASDAGLYSVVVTDATGSVTSRLAKIATIGTPSSGSGDGNGSPIGGGTGNPTAPASSGGGSFELGSALAVLVILAGAARGRHRPNPETSA